MKNQTVQLHISPRRCLGTASELLYGQFLEHFHRQVYGGVHCPESPLAKDGLRSDVRDALKKLRIPILRWPGGCFVSAYHWKDGIGPQRAPVYDKAWRVEEPNTFGTDEFIRLCRTLDCQPYLCTNAGSGSPEEMSDWVEYCNLPAQGRHARQRIENGFPAPHKVPYWSIGNENYGWHEIGTKTAEEWGRFSRESAKMMKRVDPTIQLSSAALPDAGWNLSLLQNCGEDLDWISLHQYWDELYHHDTPATYAQAMAFTGQLDQQVRQVAGLLAATGFGHSIRIAFDEWNLRSWHHPGIHVRQQAVHEKDFLLPRDKNDINQTYTMADAVFAACFLNMLHRHCEQVGMACFAPMVNGRGPLYVHREGIVLRSTYHVFEMYRNQLGRQVVDLWAPGIPVMEVRDKNGCTQQVETLDLLATRRDDGVLALAAVNKSPSQSIPLRLRWGPGSPGGFSRCRVHALQGDGPDSYNDVGRTPIFPTDSGWQPAAPDGIYLLPPHSVNILQFDQTSSPA